MTAQQKYQLDERPMCVLVDGPEESDGDGVPWWSVVFGNDSGEPICENKRAMWFCYTYEEACRLGRELAKRYGLELVNEAMQA